MPERILAQLGNGGRLVAVWRPEGAAVGIASIWTKAGDDFVRKPLFDAQVPVLDEFRCKREFKF